MIKLIDFWAPWCGPCRQMQPVIDDLEKELVGKLEIIRVNVDEKPDEASKYNVLGIPTYVILKDDKEVGRKVGITSKADLRKLID